MTKALKSFWEGRSFRDAADLSKVLRISLSREIIAEGTAMKPIGGQTAFTPSGKIFRFV